MQLRYIIQQGLDDFQKCFIDSTAVAANTERPTDSTILVRLIVRVCTTGSNLHRLDLPDMNPIGLWEQQEELRRLSQEIHFHTGKVRGEAKHKKLYFQLIRRVRRLRKRLLRDLELVRRNLEGRCDLPPSRRLLGEEALCLIADDLGALDQTALHSPPQRPTHSLKVGMSSGYVLNFSDSTFGKFVFEKTGSDIDSSCPFD